MTLLRLALLLTVLATGARAHLTHDQAREFVAAADGRTVYVRIPLPFAFAEEIAEARAREAALASPHLRPERVAGGIRYRVSAAMLADDPSFRARLARMFAFTRAGRPVAAEVAQMRLHARAPRGPLGSPEAAGSARGSTPLRIDPVFGDAVLDLRLDLARGAGPLGLRRAGPAIDLPEGVEVTNHLMVRDGSGAVMIAVPGQLGEGALFPAPDAAPSRRLPLSLALGALAAALLVLRRQRMRRPA